MDRTDRDTLIDHYFELVDAESYDRFGEVFHDDIAFYGPGAELKGLKATIDWYENRLTVEDPTHDVTRRVHGDTASVCEGWLTGYVPGEGPLEGGFVDVLEFDDEASEITRFAIYTRF